jgi:hypothetical protein
MGLVLLGTFLAVKAGFWLCVIAVYVFGFGD